MSARECGSCTLCCKVFDVPPMDKKLSVWCRRTAMEHAA